MIMTILQPPSKRKYKIKPHSCKALSATTLPKLQSILTAPRSKKAQEITTHPATSLQSPDHLDCHHAKESTRDHTTNQLQTSTTTGPLGSGCHSVECHLQLANLANGPLWCTPHLPLHKALPMLSVLQPFAHCCCTVQHFST